MTTKKDWHPFKGLTLEIRFRGTPKKWTRGRIVSWHKNWVEFVKQGRVRPMQYLEEEIWGINIITRRPRNEEL
jgi:hypothetical protein